MPPPEPTSGWGFQHMTAVSAYSDACRRLLDGLKIDEDGTVADVGCGAGALTEILVREHCGARGPRIVALDPSEVNLEFARRRVHSPHVDFRLGIAQELVRHVAGAQVVLLGAVIHQLPPQERALVLRCCHDALAPGGELRMSTPFYEGRVPAEARMFYARWLRGARRRLADAGIAVDRGAPRAASLQLWTAEQYAGAAQAAGFADIRVDAVDVPFPRAAWDALSQYSVFIRGALPGVRDAEGSEALRGALREALAVEETVPRSFLFLTARRP